MALRLTTAAMAAMLLAVSGCGGDSGGGGNGTQSREITLQVVADPEEAEAYRTLISAFEAKQPDTEVKLVPIADQGDNVAKLATAFSGGSPPDLFLINYRRFGQFAERGVLEPLGERIDSRGRVKLADLYPQAVDAFRFDGVDTCVPQNISTPVVYFNTALFERFKVPHPKAGWTWEDMRSIALVLTKGDVRGLGFEPGLNRFAPFIWQAGGEVVDDLDQPHKVTVDDPPDLEALQYLTGLQSQYEVVPNAAEFEGEDPEARFADGRLGMLIESRRATTTLRATPGLEWDVAPLPVHPRVRRPAVMLHSDAYCMAKASEAKDAAYAFVEFAIGREGAAVLAKTGRTVPSLRELAESPAFLDPSQPPASAQVFLDQIPHIKRFPNIGAWNEIESKADVVIEEYFFEGGADPAELGFQIDVATQDIEQP